MIDVATAEEQSELGEKRRLRCLPECEAKLGKAIEAFQDRVRVRVWNASGARTTTAVLILAISREARATNRQALQEMLDQCEQFTTDHKFSDQDCATCSQVYTAGLLSVIFRWTLKLVPVFGQDEYVESID